MDQPRFLADCGGRAAAFAKLRISCLESLHQFGLPVASCSPVVALSGNSQIKEQPSRTGSVSAGAVVLVGMLFFLLLQALTSSSKTSARLLIEGQTFSIYNRVD